MTRKMRSCVDHIKTSVDVDPWAAEMVERMFGVLEDVAVQIERETNEAREDFDEYALVHGYISRDDDALGAMAHDNFRQGMTRAREIILEKLAEADG